MLAYLLYTDDIETFTDIAYDKPVETCKRDGVFAFTLSFERVEFKYGDFVKFIKGAGLFDNRHPLDITPRNLFPVGFFRYLNVTVLLFKFTVFKAYLQADTPSSIHPIGEHSTLVLL